MTTTGETPELALLRGCFETVSKGDFTLLEQVLTKDASWRAVYEGPANCEGRERIIEVMSRNLAGRVRGSIEEMIQHGSRVVVGFRPEQPADTSEQPADTSDRPLDRGIAYMVVTIDGGAISELKGCADRAGAIAYAQTGELPKP